MLFFSFDWQVVPILTQSEFLCLVHRLTFFEPRHYGGVFGIQKDDYQIVFFYHLFKFSSIRHIATFLDVKSVILYETNARRRS